LILPTLEEAKKELKEFMTIRLNKVTRDLEENTVDDVLRILRAEFEE
jgi:hypothetical protein